MSEDSRHGVDYLVDWYAVLGVARDAKIEVIRETCRAQQFKYHPDRYERLAEEFKEAAGRRFVLLAEAAKVLLDAEARAIYDRQLEGWKGPLSTNGNPVIVIGEPHYAPMRLIDPHRDERLRSILEQARTLSGFDEKSYRALERMMSLPNPDAEIVLMYRGALLRRSICLAVEEMCLWGAAGYVDREINNEAPRAYLTQAEADIAQERKTITLEVTSTLLALEGREVKLLTQGSSDTKAIFDQSMVVQKHEDALQRYDEMAQLIRAKAVERQEVIEKRLRYMAGEYRPEQPQRFPRLVLVVAKEDVEFLFAFRLQDPQAGQSAGFEGLKCLDELGVDDSIVDEGADALNARGINVMHFDFEEGIDCREQLNAVVGKHFEPFLPKEEETPETS